MNEQASEQFDAGYQEALAMLEGLAGARLTAGGKKGDGEEQENAIPSSALHDTVRKAVPQEWAEPTLRQLLETLPDALVVINQAGVIVLNNPHTELTFGYQ